MNEAVMTAAGLGLALGLRHALDTDHLVAVTSLLSTGRPWWRSAGIGLWWGAGHAVTLVAVGLPFLAFGWTVPESWQGLAEGAVGLVIAVLGASIIRQHWRDDVHWHRHRHGAVEHAHFHRHEEDEGHGHAHEAGHEHDHGLHASGRRGSFLVGGIHGLAGSGPLVILLALSLPTPAGRYAALLSSAAGSVLGMGLVTAILGIPFYWTARNAGPWAGRLRLAVGAGSAIYGLGFLWLALTPLWG